MKYILGTFFFLVFVGNINSQQSELLTYSAFTIPDSLKKDANAIVRLDEGVLDVVSNSRYTLNVHQVVTILNPEGAYHLKHSFGFDKFYKIENVEVKVYNELGLLSKKYSKKDFDIQSAYDGVSFVTDDKLMYLYTPAPGYPCTVETNYQINAVGYIDLPDWHINTNNSSTEVFRYTVKVPEEIDIRYRTVNFMISPSITSEKKERIYKWVANNISVKKIEEGGYEAAKYLPAVQIGANRFSYDGFEGEFSNWKDFGKWSYPFYSEKKPFSDERINEIRLMTEKSSSLFEKVDVLYSYLKMNMRYVSIQLGIGGFKPFSARFVDEKKYGDCKALTNYMRSLLAVVGITSYPALINAGYNKFPADPLFPSSPFNHVILCVPNKNDTIWLECTSNNARTGFLGSFTENKHALLVTENGGILVKTPVSRAANNTLVINNDIFLDVDGGAKVNTSVYGTGDFLLLLKEQQSVNVDAQKEFFVKYLNYKIPDDYKQLAIIDSSVGTKADFELGFDKLYDFKAGNKVFYPIQINKISEGEIKLDANRQTEYIFSYPYEKINTTRLHMPAGFAFEKLPAEEEFDSEYLYYKKNAVYDAATRCITMSQLLTLKKNIISPLKYNQVAELLNKFNKGEDAKFVFTKE